MPSLKSVTLKDVAALAKVSQSVVSTVLNDRQNGIFVSEGTRLNVLAAAAALGYEVRPRALPPIRKPGPARAGATGNPGAQGHLVGVLLGRRFGGSLFTDTFYGINESLAAQEFHPLVLDTYAETYPKAAEKEADCLRYARESGFAGLVLWHEGGPANVEMIQELRREMPVVAIDRRVPGLALDFVGTDNYGGAYEATRHLIAQGHTRIAHLTRMETTEAAADRLRGYQAALRDAALEFNPRDLILLHGGGQRLDPAQVASLFTGPDRPTAVFLLADYWAPAIVAELRRLDLRVPEEVALVGFDDVVPPGLDDLGLTTMAQDFSGIGRTAGELILRRLADPDAACATQVFPARLIVRQSTLGYAASSLPAAHSRRPATLLAAVPPAGVSSSASSGKTW